MEFSDRIKTENRPLSCMHIAFAEVPQETDCDSHPGGYQVSFVVKTENRPLSFGGRPSLVLLIDVALRGYHCPPLVFQGPLRVNE